jgi:4-hydroxybenzoate polyprenyltransferase
LIGRLRELMDMIKFAHTVFALPFAVMGMVLAARGLPPAETVLWILVAMVGARTAAMGWNRVADARIDARNPRTAGRSIPAGRVSPDFALVLTLAAAAVFVLACGLINEICLALSPVVLLVLALYPFTKRFTAGSHVVLGLALGLSPVGAWVAVRGAFGPGVEAVVLLGGAVALWVAGFDVLYACQDLEHDRREPGLHSIPKTLGLRRALHLARGLHLAAVLALVGVALLAPLGWIYAAGVLLAAALLHREHAILSPEDLSRLDVAFFPLNGLVSLLIGGLAVVDVLVRG